MRQTVAVGGLEFAMENRKVGEDGGPSIQLLANVEGKRVQLLRFDMFHKEPHYHYDPNGQDLRYNLDPLTHDDAIGWTISQLRSKLLLLVAKAGYGRIRANIDSEVVVAALPEIERLWRSLGQAPGDATG